MSKDRNFRELLEAQWDQDKFVCVGLDSDLAKIPDTYHVVDPEQQDAFLGLDPESTIFAFNEYIIDVTKNAVCAYKPNIAFYEAYGDRGWLALKETIAHIQKVAPDVPVILDAKRADIGNTNTGYARMAFEQLKADAITVHPYLGGEALAPFLEYKNKGIFVLCRTSNPGANELQDLIIMKPGAPADSLLYQYLAHQVATKWNSNGNCGLVVGATRPQQLMKVREIVGDMPILIPGIGAQGGDVEATVQAGQDNRGRGMIINSSRDIIFSKDPLQKTLHLNQLINQFRKR